MNFLSHFYFERYSENPHRVLGSLLPDLLKNVDKSYNFHPKNFEDMLRQQVDVREIDLGWARHVEVDRLFHNSEFFVHHNHQLRLILTPLLVQMPIRPLFMAHVAIELLLDHLLISESVVQVGRLYEQLSSIQTPVLKKYLETIGFVDFERFMTFFDKFTESKYIFEYISIDQLTMAIFSICKRLWVFEVEDSLRGSVEEELRKYKDKHMTNYMDIFKHLDDNLIHLT